MSGRPATADRPLTVRQTKFAADVADGLPKVKAYRKNYAPSPNHPQGESNKAADLARAPHVAAEIRRLTWLSCPPVDGIRGMREHAVRIISDLSRSAKSEAVRLQAAQTLLALAEKHRDAANPRRTDAEQDRILDALRQLYRKAQVTAGNPPPVDLLPHHESTPLSDSDEVIDLDAIATEQPIIASKETSDS